MGVLGLVDGGRGHGRRRKVEFGSVSLPKPVLAEVDELIRLLGHWPSRSAFVREAALEKIRKERRRLRELREAEEAPMKGDAK